ncbi:MAG TPA: MXAN_6640 family putative metalloprotease, partial [Ignavibacteriaceae bacterium]
MDSPFGIFRIHYNSSGFNTPNYTPASIDENVMEVARALDSVYRFEINALGYPLPPADNGNGGNDRYDVYITNQPSGLYGYTETEQKVGATNWSSFMVIDDNYTGYYSEGLDGMKVTVAHEFHHGIQLGNYGVLNSSSPFRDVDVYFYEITSVSMEEFVYDDINDYYAYMPDYFRYTYNSFPQQNGYNMAIWNLYLQENFGFDILKRQWELIPTNEAILAINQSLIDFSSTFPGELNKFGIWTYFTGFRRVPGKYFEEAANYPLVTPTFTIQFPSSPPQMQSSPTANNFVKFNISSAGDTLVAIVTNGDAFETAENHFQLFDFDYTLYSNATSGQRSLTENYSADFFVGNPNFWSVSEILNDGIVRQDSIIIPSSGTLEYAYPNPFYYGRNYLTGTDLFFPADLNLGDEADFNVYSSGMMLVYSSEKIIQNLPGNQKGVLWDGLDSNGNRLASGVYIYVIKKDDEDFKGKVV